MSGQLSNWKNKYILDFLKDNNTNRTGDRSISLSLLVILQDFLLLFIDLSLFLSLPVFAGLEPNFQCLLCHVDFHQIRHDFFLIHFVLRQAYVDEA